MVIFGILTHMIVTKETIARGMNKERLNSQLVITYYLVNQRYQMDSFNDSVVHDQYEIVPISNGFE